MRDDIDVLIHEVGPRDGLQSIKTIFPTDVKLHWIRAEAAAGVPQIQVGSFVRPDLLPQMADSAEVVKESVKIPGLIVSALVPNLKGAQNAMTAGAHQLGVVMSVSEAHNKANINRTGEESLEEFRKIVAYRDEVDPEKKTVISGGLATSFGCTISGPVPVRDVMQRAERLLELGADRLNVADTVGYANPKQVRDLFEELFRTVGKDVPVGAHFHDTRGLGLANAFAAVEAGVRELDGCLGGLGGCPYAPGASGNVVTEDMVFMLEAMGLKTGVDLDALLEVREYMVKHLGDEPTQGTFVQAGPPLGFIPATQAA